MSDAHASTSRVAIDDGDVQLYHGDVCDVLRSLPDGVAQTCVTSPPYWGLRDYGTGEWTGGDADCDHLAPPSGGPNPERYTPGGGEMWRAANDKAYQGECGRCGARRVDQQLGLEATPELYVERMVAVFREVWRVLRDDGTLWLNLGDSYTSGGRDGFGPQSGKQQTNVGSLGMPRAMQPPGLKPKDLVGIPWRVAFALQQDGWYLRSDIIWSKPNPMPESVTDRPTKAHEYVFLLAKRSRYFYDADAVREPQDSLGERHNGKSGYREGHPSKGGISERSLHPVGRNLRSVWEVATEPFPEAHFATYPQALVRRCILAGTSEHGECSECGAPWMREVNRPIAPPEVFTDTTKPQDGHVLGHHVNGQIRGQGQKLQDWRDANPPQTTGWRTSCSCGAPTRPQTVVDPFIGSGTTALVARKHGRRCIGIDLSAEYLDIAGRRLQQLSLFADPAGRSEDTPEAECV